MASAPYSVVRTDIRALSALNPAAITPLHSVDSAAASSRENRQQPPQPSFILPRDPKCGEGWLIGIDSSTKFALRGPEIRKQAAMAPSISSLAT